MGVDMRKTYDPKKVTLLINGVHLENSTEAGLTVYGWSMAAGKNWATAIQVIQRIRDMPVEQQPMAIFWAILVMPKQVSEIVRDAFKK